MPNIKQQIDAATAAHEATTPASTAGLSPSQRVKASSVLATARAAKKQIPASSKGPKEQATWPIQKPNGSKFHRVHPDENYRVLNCPVLSDPDDENEYYFCPDDVKELLPEYVATKVKYIDLHAAQDHTGAQYLWPVKHGSPKWRKAANNAVARARRGWVSLTAILTAQTYNLHSPVNEIAAPDWSQYPEWDVMLDSVFEGDRTISGPEHNIVVKIMGGTPEADGDE